MKRRSNRVRWVAAAVAVPVLVLVLVLAASPPAGTRAADSPLLGEAAPALEGETVDGHPFALAGAPGRWVLVNFFATWCVPCVREHPELIRFADRHAAAGDAEVVAVVYDDPAAEVRKFRAQRGGDWPMVVDPNGRIALDFGVSGVPESYLIAPDGTVAAKLVGGVAADALDEVLAKVKAGTPLR
ncbi:MAG: TlpA family protein disulfide reductase [Acidimicrobiia bacterium]